MTAPGTETAPRAVEPQPHIMRVGDLDVRVRVSERRRSIRLTIERDATVTAVIPPETDEARLADVIKAKRRWLYAKIRDRADATGLDPRRPGRHGSSSPARGSRTSAVVTGC